ncbi:MAG TPA: hypothetical protein PKY78_07790 [Candidatus Omnitrophota bacterium]|nr:hypothetical protein [Candidatus Omnitrophota bacterium]HPS20869.1 hypothetical protein [Candidatus Omnitrophota bacterium]
MSEMSLFTPPIAFLIVFIAIAGLSHMLSGCAAKRSSKTSGEEKSYSCGEEFDGHMIQPDYSQFFPFAFFFTILHVVVLTIAIIPLETVESLFSAVIYIMGAVLGLLILLRRYQ